MPPNFICVREKIDFKSIVSVEGHLKTAFMYYYCEEQNICRSSVNVYKQLQYLGFSFCSTNQKFTYFL